MKKKLVDFLKKNLNKTLDYESLIEKPKNSFHGDFSVPMFILSKELKKNPVQISKEFEELLSKKLPEFLEKIVSVGPYLNFYLNNNLVLSDILNSVSDESLFKVKASKKEKILVEYPSPNTNKALHIGHVRNILLGNSISHFYKTTGHEVVRTNLNNDRGIAVCKAMLGYELYFNGKNPKDLDMKPDEFVEMCYVKFETESKKNEKLLKDAQSMLVKWEAGDKEIIKLWKKILKWVYDGYDKTYSRLKLDKFEKEYFESEIYDKGKEIVENALKNKVEGFERDDTNAVLVDFKNETYGKKYLLRGDGTTLYMTQDIHLASLKEKEFKADKYVFVVGKEQEYHFQVLFEILGRLGFGGADKNYHFAYGYVYDKNGKKFSSRKGNTLRANGLLDLIEERAKENLKSKELTKNLSEKELNKRAQVVAYCALSYTMLSTNPKTDIKFDIEKALAFDGESGPYILYTYARIQSILRKANCKVDFEIDFSLYDEKEILLIKELGKYSEIILESAEKMKPSHLFNYLMKLSQMFNEFYHLSPILNSDDNLKKVRLVLAFSLAVVLKKGLELFDVDVLDEM